MLLATAAALMVACRGNDNRDASGTLADTSTAAAGADPITDILIIAVPDRTPLLGRRVLLTGVKVQTVTGDRTFWVGPEPTRQLFVVLNEERNPGPDSATVIRPGQTITIAGMVRAIPADLATMERDWSLSAANMQTLGAERIYLAADRVEITSK